MKWRADLEVREYQTEEEALKAVGLAQSRL